MVSSIGVQLSDCGPKLALTSAEIDAMMSIVDCAGIRPPAAASRIRALNARPQAPISEAAISTCLP